MKPADFLELTTNFGKGTRLTSLYAKGISLDAREISVRDKSLINFASCSYLGLEVDFRLKQGAINAVQKYGSQFSSSRSFISSPLYYELEKYLSKIFNTYIVISPTTTLGHCSALPVLIEKNDAIIFDQQVHNSVRMAIGFQEKITSFRNIVRHNDMDQLERCIQRLRKKTNVNKIWYMGDGVYSMYGDLSLTKNLLDLLNRYDNFYCYLDDAHGTSWTGYHGKGSVLGSMDGIHDKIVVTASLNKSFACAGGVIVLPNKEWKEKITLGGPPMVFSGPIPPPMLGAAVESAKIHLSDEIQKAQNKLVNRIKYFNKLSFQLDLPLMCDEISPIRYLNLKSINATVDSGKALYANGIYVNIVCYPIVPHETPGIRIAITKKHRYEDIKLLLETIKYLTSNTVGKAHSRITGKRAPKKKELVGI